MKILLLSVTGIFTTFLFNVGGQSVVKPNFGLKSPETIDIKKIEGTEDGTTIYLSIKNMIDGGYFCADKNISIIYPDGSKSRLISSDGIPTCPETYKFKYIGEVLDFMLRFPPLKPGIEWIDLVEECNDNCFYFSGISLDNELNKKIDAAFDLAEKGESAAAMNSFIAIEDQTDSKDLGTEGLMYINIIMLAKETANTEQADKWYKRFEASGAPHLSQYIKYLNDRGIKY